MNDLHPFRSLNPVTWSASYVRSIEAGKDAANSQIHYVPLSGPAFNYIAINEKLHEWIPVATQLWGIGVCFLSLRLACDYFRLSRLTPLRYSAVDEQYVERLASLAKRMGIRKSILLIESAFVEIPTVMGWLSPVVIVPMTFFTSLSAGQIEAILAHELAHVRRYDYCVNLFQLIIETALFYHPTVSWISHLIREERENCCDDIAISVGGDKITYVSALATLERGRVLPGNTALAANGGSLLKRVQRVFGACEPISFTDLFRESYKGMVLGVFMIGAVCAVCVASNQGSFTIHADRTNLAQALVTAAQHGNLSELKNLLDRGADSDANVRPSGNNALFTAVAHNQVEAVKLLLRYGGHVDGKNTAGQRAMDWALAKGDLAMATLLRENGAAISSAAWAGATGDLGKLRSLVSNGELKKGGTDETMKDAVSMGRLDVVKFLEGIEGKPVAGNFLADAASSGNIPMMDYVLRQGANIQTDGENAMDQAVIFYDQPEAARFLLSHGANPNRFTRWGRYILSQAKSAQMIKVLLEAGANPNCEDAFGTPLSNAPNADSIRLLFKYGAKLDRTTNHKSSIIENAIIRDYHDKPDVIEELRKQGAILDPATNGVSALAMAAEQNNLMTIHYLLDLGVNPNAFSNEPRVKTSPLRIATIVLSLDAVKLFLERGGTAREEPRDGITPLSLALLSGDEDMANLLRKAGARDVCDLSVAAAFGDVSEVSRLIAQGADVNEADRGGNTPLFYAMQRGQSDVVRLLLRHGAVIHDPGSTKA